MRFRGGRVYNFSVLFRSRFGADIANLLRMQYMTMIFMAFRPQIWFRCNFSLFAMYIWTSQSLGNLITAYSCNPKIIKYWLLTNSYSGINLNGVLQVYLITIICIFISIKTAFLCTKYTKSSLWNFTSSIVMFSNLYRQIFQAWQI